MDEFIEQYFRFNPVKATLFGNHKFDNQLNSLTNETINYQLKQLQKFQQRLNNIDSTLLSEQNKIDYIILAQVIDTQFWELKDYRLWESDATFYNNIFKYAVIGITKSNTIPLNIRCKNLFARLKQFPVLIHQAKHNLVSPTRLSIEYAINQLSSLTYQLSSEISKVAHNSSVWQDSLLFYDKLVSDSLSNYSTFLEKELLIKATLTNPIGEELYPQILKNRYHIKWTTKEIIARANEEYQKCYQQVVDISNQLYKEYYQRSRSYKISERKIIEEVLDNIYNNYAQDELLVDLVNDIIEDIKRFISVKELINLPDDYILHIVRTHESDPNQELAYLDVPGPLESKQEYYYYLKSLPKDKNWLEQISFLKMFNKSVLQVLIMQDILPGKLLMFSRFNEHPSLIRAIFRDEIFIAGWPFHAGLMMLDAGYEGYDLKIKLIHSLYYLRAVVRAIIDVQYHTSQISQNEALSILVRDGIVDINQARDNLNQIMLNPCRQLLPFLGYVQIKSLYNESRLLEGNYFSRTKFWKRLLSYGAIPLSLLSKKIKSNQLKQ